MDLNKLNRPDSAQNQGVSGKQSNPILPEGLMSKINSLNNRTTANRLYAGYNNHNNWMQTASIDYAEIIKFFNEVIKDKETQNELFYSLHNICVNRLNAMFTAFGVFNEQSSYINLKIIDKIGSTFTSRILINGFFTNTSLLCLSNSSLPGTCLKYHS